MTILRRPGAAITTLLFILMGAAFLTQVVPTRQIFDSQRQVNAARAQLAALQTDNALLEADVTALGTDAEIEKLAREKLGYVRPGEIAYIVLDPPEEDRAPPASPSLSELPERQTWVDQLWDFLTGADLES
jgi:cell division protein FtsB